MPILPRKPKATSVREKTQKAKHNPAPSKVQRSIFHTFKSEPSRADVEKKQKSQYLKQKKSNPSSSYADQRVTEFQFLRDSSFLLADSLQQPVKDLPLNDKIPLSV